MVCVGPRCERTSGGTAIWTATKTTSVTAIAGTVRRSTAPDVTPEGEGEGGVADRDDAARAEHRRRDPRDAEHGVSSLPAAIASSIGPAHHVTSRLSSPTPSIAAKPIKRELGGQPAGTGDGLVPRQAVRAGLELAGDQRRAPERADDRRRDQQRREADVEDGDLQAVGLQQVEEAGLAGPPEVGQPGGR